MMVNETLDLSILSWGLAEDLKSSLTHLRWYTLKVWLQANKNTLIVARRPELSSIGVGLKPTNSQEDSSGSNDVLPPPSDDDDE